MKTLIKKLTPGSLRRFFTRLGRFYEEKREAPEPPPPIIFPSQEGTFQTLRQLGWVPKYCIDVGAYHGYWANMFHSIFPESHVLMIEAQEAKREVLQQISAASAGCLDYEIALLGADDGQEVEFVEMETGSSVFEESSPYDRTKVLKKLTTLDTLLKTRPDFAQSQALKLDTQGYELEVLRGALGLLKNVEVVLLEVSLLPINRNAPLLADIVSFMTAHDFKVFDFCSQIRRKDGVLWQTDLLFVRNGSGIRIPLELNKDNWA